MDQHLRWKTHIDNLVKRLRRIIYLILILRNFLSTKIIEKVYCTICQSSIEYAICTYGSASKMSLNRLEVAQKLVLKIMYKKPRLNLTDRLFKETKIHDIK